MDRSLKCLTNGIEVVALATKSCNSPKIRKKSATFTKWQVKCEKTPGVKSESLCLTVKLIVASCLAK